MATKKNTPAAAMQAAKDHLEGTEREPMSLAEATALDQERQEEERLAAEAAEEERRVLAYLRHLPGGEELVASVRSFLLDRLRDTQDARPWNMRSEADQQRVIKAAEETARMLVREIVGIVAANSFRHVAGVLEQVTAKGGFKVVIKVPKSAEAWADLGPFEGRPVTIVLADPQAYDGHMPPVNIRRDEPTLPGIVREEDDSTGEREDETIFPESGESERPSTAREASEEEDRAAREADLQGVES
ncbi:hypothetical protein [Falsiroseomonas tokyonensis]|uniref:Uncharacterized protein n=1 Tax=Falsiroseomonas tokyonensis TaxID=430521 RepID=A0ABV7BZF4_9PROT|nr:hypothetical protein [Falsiroseomonas tokyonensis]MBU8540232.1 hypothetical protein [Falsiroseomonas tokyonensis]